MSRFLAIVITLLVFAAPTWACPYTAGIQGQVYSYSQPPDPQPVRYIQAPQRIQADTYSPCNSSQAIAADPQPVVYVQREVTYRQPVVYRQRALRETAGYSPFPVLVPAKVVLPRPPRFVFHPRLGLLVIHH